MSSNIEAAASRIIEKGSRMLAHPDEVVRDPRMTPEEKRATLAAWASDAHAVEGLPALRQLDDGSVVKLDDILHALRALDTLGSPARGLIRTVLPPKRGTFLSRIRSISRHSNDDDDPPPCPASAGFPARIPVVDALAA